MDSVMKAMPVVNNQVPGGKAFFLKQMQVSSENLAVTLTKRDHVIYAAELELNSLPLHVCQHLVLNSFHVQLGALTGAHIAVKGKYFTEEDKLKLSNAGRELPYRALYLDVTAQNISSVEEALNHLAQKITSSMQQRPKATKKPDPQVPQIPPNVPAPVLPVLPNPPLAPPIGTGNFPHPNIPNPAFIPPPNPSNQPFVGMSPPVNMNQGGNPNAAQTPVNHHTPLPNNPPAPLPEEKLPVGVTLVNSPNNFKLIQKLTGENNVNLEYIQRESGARVSLRGLGSGYLESSTNKEARESLHFRIAGPEGALSGTNAINKARQLLSSLLDTLREDLKKHTALNSQNNFERWKTVDRNNHHNMYYSNQTSYPM